MLAMHDLSLRKTLGGPRSRIVRTKKLKIPNPGIFNFSPEHETSDTANVTDRTGAERDFAARNMGAGSPPCPSLGHSLRAKFEKSKTAIFRNSPFPKPMYVERGWILQKRKDPNGGIDF